MPLRLDIKKTLSARSERVKCVEFHPTEPWVLTALYSGNVILWDHTTQCIVRQGEVSSVPIRCAKFVVRKQWIAVGSDDMQIRLLNYNTMERVKAIENAHSDYIRYIAVHPTLPILLSCGDDMSIKAWDWDKNWQCSQTFDGHVHYVMMVQFNPKDPSTFASASLDRTVKLWGIQGSSSAHFTLTGHTRGVNCIDFSPSGEKPYLLSGADDQTIRIWDYQTRQCLHTFEGHTGNITACVFHLTLPIILTAAEDGLCKIWHANTYRLESTLNYLMERLWSVAVVKGSNHAALGYDEGTVVIKLGNEEPVASYHSGKVAWAKGTEIQTVTLKAIEPEILASLADGAVVPVSAKDLGVTEIFPQSIAHHPSGRLISVCGDGEYVIYTSQALRNKNFGQAAELVWAGESGQYATRDGNRIKIFSDFKETFSFIPDFAVEQIYGGPLLCVKGAEFICFYDWEKCRLIRKIEEVPNLVIWSESGGAVALCCEEQIYLLSYDAAAVTAAVVGGAQLDEDGLEAAFELIQEISENATSGVWVGDVCFAFISAQQKLQSTTGGQLETLAHLDRPMTLLGYLSDHNRVYLISRELEIVSYSIDLSLVDYKAAIIRKDFAAAEAVFTNVPTSLYTRAARFLEHQGLLAEALELTTDSDHKLELALQLDRLPLACQIVEQSRSGLDLSSKWKLVGDKALEAGQVELAKRCYTSANDAASLFLVGASVGDADALKKAATLASDSQANVALWSSLIVGDVESCLSLLSKAGRHAEACILARTYAPEKTSEHFGNWREELSRVNKQLGQALKEPSTRALQ